jgi:hypothetical protein
LHLAPYSSLLTCFRSIIKEDPPNLKEKYLDLFYDVTELELTEMEEKDGCRNRLSNL